MQKIFRLINSIAYYFLLILSWAVALCVYLRADHFLPAAASFFAFAQLAIYVSFWCGVIIALRFSMRNSGGENQISSLSDSKTTQFLLTITPFEKAIIVGPGLVIGIFLVCPSLKPFEITLYFSVYAASIFLCEKQFGSSVKEEKQIVDTEKFAAAKHELSGQTDTAPLNLKSGNNNFVNSEPEGTQDESENEEVYEESFAEDADEDDNEKLDKNVLMNLTRKLSENGNEQLEALVRAEFAQEERIVSVYIPFVPAFAVTPQKEQIQIHQIDGDEVTETLTQITSLGARIDLRRPANRKRPETVRLCVFVEMCTEHSK
ncbi:MAG: hypothetical protein ACRC2T_07310 [Thermoguttaceae bacterium]